LSIALSPGFILGVSANFGFPRFIGNKSVYSAMLPAQAPFRSIDAAGNPNFGLSAGVLIRPARSISFGFSYMSPVKYTFEDVAVSYSASVDSIASSANQLARGGIGTPGIFSGGVALSPVAFLLLEVDAEYALWRSIQGAQHPALSPAVDMSGWSNAWTLHTGIEVTISGVDVRAGYMFDQTPVPDASISPALPDANKRGFSGGIGYWVSEGLRLDFALQYLKFDDRSVALLTQPADAVYQTKWTVVGINVSYHWD
jgi:long-chain fatty acid transport protein